MPEQICQNVPGRQNISNNDAYNRISKSKQQPGSHKENDVLKGMDDTSK